MGLLKWVTLAVVVAVGSAAGSCSISSSKPCYSKAKSDFSKLYQTLYKDNSLVSTKIEELGLKSAMHDFSYKEIEALVKIVKTEVSDSVCGKFKQPTCASKIKAKCPKKSIAASDLKNNKDLSYNGLNAAC